MEIMTMDSTSQHTVAINGIGHSTVWTVL